ncbi:hypothetical protein C0431_12765 [bacterium]|nr:hypothetical protein [bacterium]
MSSPTMFFNSSPEGKALMKHSGYYHISDILLIADAIRKDKSLKYLTEKVHEEAVIDLILEEKWKVKT